MVSRRSLILAALAMALVAAAEGRTRSEPVVATHGVTRFEVPRVEADLRVDGELDEAAWAQALRLELAYEVRPADNAAPPVRTEALLMADAGHLYVAFIAEDPAPGAIRAHYSDRDSVWDDDWVGIVLDTFNDRRRAYDFLVNPVGVQMDFVESEVGGGVDRSWDAIWRSAGRITADGYLVEMAIPFDTMRFPDGAGEQVWAFDLTRSYPRGERHHIGVFPRDRNRNCYLCQAWELTGFAAAGRGAQLQLTPTLTAARTDLAGPDGELEAGEVEEEAGLTAAWGVTPNLILGAALNPDFSQVEADAAQLAVNERFALFYTEKRPFFVEGSDYFATPLDAVYTRTVADPAWGVKVTGKQGANALGAFAARDEVTTLLLPGSQSSRIASLDDEALAAVGRWRRDIGESSALGVLVTGRTASAYTNLVAGVDGVLRFTPRDRLGFQLLGSSTEYPEEIATAFGQPRGRFTDHALLLEYAHETAAWHVAAAYADLGEGFRADLGFVPRVGERRGDLNAYRRWWGEGRWYSWIDLGVQASRGEDRSGALLDEESGVYLNLQGPWQSKLHLHPTRGRESWRGEVHSLDGVHLSAEASPAGWLGLSLAAAWGGAVDYANGRPADLLRLVPGATLRLGRHVALEADHQREELDVGGGRLYRAGLSQLRLVYQLDLRTFVRVIGQHLDLERDPMRYLEPVAADERELFTQLLLSYTLNPQTVLFLGYSDNNLAEGGLDLARTDRTFFLKIGYAWLL